MKKMLPIFIAVMVAVGGGAFYGGMWYAKSKASQVFSRSDFQNLRNLSPEERQQRFREIATGADGSHMGSGGGQRGGNGFAAGEIVSKDDKSVTVKLREGGSKIVFFSDTTEIGKFTEGSSGDLEIGKTVTVNGEANSDGSITAASIQVRPQAPSPAPRNPDLARVSGDAKEFAITSFYEMVDGKPKSQFSLSEIRVKKGDRVRIKITNARGMHDFVLEEFGVAKETPLNEEVIVEFTADKAGEFVYYCSKPNHRALGQWGTLVVEG